MQLSAQAAAGALGSLAGPACQDFILCAEPQLPAEAEGDGSLVRVEVTLLVLRSADGQAAGAAGAARRALPQQQFGVGPAVPPPPRQPPQPQKLPASSWNMLSAMAGGTAASSKAAAPPAEQKQAQQAHHAQRSIPNFFGGGRKQQAEQSSGEKQQQAEAPAEAPARSPSPPPAAAQQQRVPVQRPQRQVPAAAAAPAGQPAGEKRRMTVGDYLVNSLTAQSLDLPPAVSGTAGCPALLGSASAALQGRWQALHCFGGGLPGRPACRWRNPLLLARARCRRRSGGRSTAATPSRTAS